MPPIPYRTYVKGHPGSSKEEIENEPDWSSAKHHIGYRNRYVFLDSYTAAMIQIVRTARSLSSRTLKKSPTSYKRN
jgi:hypothetical protein